MKQLRNPVPKRTRTLPGTPTGIPGKQKLPPRKPTSFWPGGCAGTMSAGQAFTPTETPRRIPLPTYPFDTTRFWPPDLAQKPGEEKAPPSNTVLVFTEAWKEAPPAPSGRTGEKTLVCLLSREENRHAFHQALVSENPGIRVIFISASDRTLNPDPSLFCVPPDDPESLVNAPGNNPVPGGDNRRSHLPVGFGRPGKD